MSILTMSIYTAAVLIDVIVIIVTLVMMTKKEADSTAGILFMLAMICNLYAVLFK